MLHRTHLFRRAAALALAATLLLACAGRSQARLDVVADFEPAPPRVGPVTATLRIARSDGGSLAGAELRVEANMNHAGMVPVFADAEPTDEAGVYHAEFKFTMAGDWYLAVTARTETGEELTGTTPVPGVQRTSGA